MGLPPWETSDSQLFALITGANRYANLPTPESYIYPGLPIVLALCFAHARDSSLHHSPTEVSLINFQWPGIFDRCSHDR